MNIYKITINLQGKKKTNPIRYIKTKFFFFKCTIQISKPTNKQMNELMNESIKVAF